MYYVKEKYQYRSSQGIKWTDWFTLDGFHTEDEAKNYLAQYKKKITGDKLKHEFDIVYDNSTEIIRND